MLARGHLRSVVGVGRSRFASLLQHGLTGKLYSAAAEKTGEKKAKEIFTMLADRENGHFENPRTQLGFFRSYCENTYRFFRF
ncbi:MAG: hypothetical protein ACOCYG_07325 [Spirochaetota bacterium]